MERPQSHITDSLGKAQMRSIFESVGWAVNEIEDDYGIDFDVQLFEDGKATGEWFKVQLKSSGNTAYSTQRDFISETLSQKHTAHFSTQMRDPVFVIHADVKAGRTFWYPPQLDTPVSATDPRENVTLRIPTPNELPAMTGPSFCTTASERVYITAIGCEIGFDGTRGLQAAGAGGL